HRDGGAVERDLHFGMDRARELPLGALRRHEVAIHLHRHARRHGDRELADTRHMRGLPYQTRASNSPPVRCWRASRSVIRPLEVDRMATPRPLRTRGISAAPTYWRRPGDETRFSSRITGVLPAYLSDTRRIFLPSGV